MKNLLKKFFPLTEKTALFVFSSAFFLGSGALWLIPFKFYQYGGLTYFFLLFISLAFFTVPALGAEMLAGRASQTTLLDSFSALRRPKWTFLGYSMILALILFAAFFSEYSVYATTSLEKSIYFSFSDNPNWSDTEPSYLKYVNLLIAISVSFALLSLKIYRNENSDIPPSRLGIPLKLKTFSNLFLIFTLIFILTLLVYLWANPVSFSRIVELFFSMGSRANKEGILLEVLADSFFIFLAGRGVLFAFSGYFQKETGVTTFSIRLISIGIFIAFLFSFLLIGIIFINEEEGKEIILSPALLFEKIPVTLLRLSAGKLVLFLFFAVLFVIFTVTLSGWMEIVGSSISLILQTSRSLSLKIAGIIFFSVFMISHYFHDHSFTIPSYTETTYKYISLASLAENYDLKDWEQIKFAVSGTYFPEKYFTNEQVPEAERIFYSFKGNKETQTISVVIKKPSDCTGLNNFSFFMLKRYFIPVLVLLVSIFTGWILPESVKRPEFAKGDSYFSKYYNIWNVLIKYFVPGAAIILLIYG
ncbi:MAG: hypothetical protein A3H98_11125 [Bacteroidetes bacterium RIFCSPLOWO2_02_FULL_36_8]|nr:MAG: hypothetical protein A3H98_11125 [Bacteroidetes bacterium RIFCSPLOWO2_02_FULL_36_8]OFY70590.1 MAG: hypothetical protein A3G23_07605 [Bacteroidetes bacterium RIFCSPLOWO2_12_FULL_37_12]